jgi:general secretion pathway protein G
MVIRMRQFKRANSKRSGFTLIEVLMAVLLIAILATIAITQFTNFARDTRNAATKENLGILRNAIQKHFATMRLRCGITNSAYPPLAAVNGNDITTSATVCTTTQVPETSDRYFVSGGIPENPWSNTACTGADKRFVNDASSQNMTIGTNLSPIATGNGHCGWLYNANTGQIKANSNNNSGASNDGESAY